MIRGLIYLLIGTIFCLICFSIFGETQVDEMQRVLVRGLQKQDAIFAVEAFLVFLGAVAAGIPPFGGVFGSSRKQASWSLALGHTGLFALVGTSFLMRWAVFIFTRPAIGALELEPTTATNILLVLRCLAAVALILTPLFALLNSNLRGSLMLFILNPFIQSVFALSFGQREIVGIAVAQIISSIFAVGLLISALENLEFSPEASLQDWVALGRRDLSGAMSVIVAVGALAGISPFFGSLLLQKTLSINSIFSLVLLLNIVIGGFYVGRLLTLAFHRGPSGDGRPAASKIQRIWFVAQFILLIFMGIFWQPLYKYGAYSIRSFFGEI